MCWCKSRLDDISLVLCVLWPYILHRIQYVSFVWNSCCSQHCLCSNESATQMWSKISSSSTSEKVQKYRRCWVRSRKWFENIDNFSQPHCNLKILALYSSQFHFFILSTLFFPWRYVRVTVYGRSERRNWKWNNSGARSAITNKISRNENIKNGNRQ